MNKKASLAEAFLLYNCSIRNNNHNMKKTLTIAAVLLLAGTVHATTTPPMRPGVMSQMRGNIEQNKDVRNTIRIERKEAVGDIRENMRGQLKGLGSTTPGMMGSSTRPRMMGSTTRAEMMMQKREIRTTAKKEIALAQKDALVKRLNFAIENLTKAKENVTAFIEKRESEGKSVGSAKELLATFSTKLTAAQKAVGAVVAWKPDPKTASSTEISLTKPRETANVAIKAVNEARGAFEAVVKELRAQAKPENNNQ